MAAASFGPSLFAADELAKFRIRGLSTFDPKRTEQALGSNLLSLNLGTDQIRFNGLADYRSGHSLIVLPDNRYFAIPYGDESIPCLFLNADLKVIGELYAHKGHGFGGHAVLLPHKKTILTHFNKAEKKWLT
ncbi:MAG: hypothetical protein ACI9CE_000145 [Flavobacterium sp.]